jgi:hypothetical protein
MPTTVPVDGATRDLLERLSASLGTDVTTTVAIAARALGQDLSGDRLSTPLRMDEIAWLEADLG